MRRIVLGCTGESVSAVGVGTWAHSGPHRAGRLDVGWSGHDDGEARAALRRAFDRGIDHWDTADVYGDGRAEKLIGDLWKSVRREQVFLATKVGWDRGGYPHWYHPELIRRRIERSLANLRTDHVDLYYLHHCDFGRGDVYLEDAVAMLRDLQRQGKVRYLGLSDWDCAKLRRVAELMDPDVVQAYRNVVDDEYAASGLRDWVETAGAGVVFFSPLKHGLLLGKYERPTRFASGDMRNRIPDFRDAGALVRYAAASRRLERRFREHAQPVLHGLVGALLADSPTASVLVGQRSARQAEAAAAVGEALSTRQALEVAAAYRS